MDNKTMLEGILWDLKGMADLLLHGSIEAKTPEIHDTFKRSLTEILTLQNDLYTLMSEKGMYTTNNVSETKITKTKAKFMADLESE